MMKVFFSYLDLVRTSTSSQSCSSTSTQLRPIVVQLSTSASQSHVPAHSNFIGSRSSLSNTTAFSNSQSSNVQESVSPVHLNSSNATISTSPAMLLVLDSGQLEIVLPKKHSSSSHTSLVLPVLSGIQTRLRIGTISRQDYIAFATTFPKIQPLILIDDNHFLGGFTFLANITDSFDPSTFKQASQIPHWQVAMQEEFDELQTQGTWVLVSSTAEKNVIDSKWVYKIK
ncbi:hypothetical protein ACFX2I_007523 [Malus domestica]